MCRLSSLCCERNIDLIWRLSNHSIVLLFHLLFVSSIWFYYAYSNALELNRRNHLFCFGSAEPWVYLAYFIWVNYDRNFEFIYLYQSNALYFDLSMSVCLSHIVDAYYFVSLLTVSLQRLLIQSLHKGLYLRYDKIKLKEYEMHKERTRSMNRRKNLHLYLYTSYAVISLAFIWH